MKSFIIGVTAALMLTPPALAGGCRTYYPQQSYYQPTYYPTKTVTIVEYIGIPVVTLAAFTTYNPAVVVPAAPLVPVAPVVPAAAPAAVADPCAQRMAAIEAKYEARFKAMEEKLKAAPVPQPVPAVQPKAEAPAAKAPLSLLAIAQAKCAGCHTPAVAEAKGGKFVLMKDASTLADLDARALLAVTRKISRGDMPPADNKDGIKPLTQEEGLAFLDGIDAIKPK